jgi:hypothetical protein
MTDDYQSIPVAVARAAVQESGLLDGVEGPLFLADNEAEWLPYYIGRYDPAAMPLMAKVIITREGQKPREVVISWDEYAAELEQNDPAWLEKRKQKPMSIFGAEVERHAYRVVFADVLGKIEAPRPKTAGVYSSQGDRTPDDRPAAGWDLPARDWLAEVKAVTDLPGLNKVDDEARAEGALAKVDGLQQAIMSRMLDLASAPKPKPAPRPAVTDKLAGQSPRRRRGKRSS